MNFGGHFLSAARQANGERNLGVTTANGFLVVPPRHMAIPAGKMTWACSTHESSYFATRQRYSVLKKIVWFLDFDIDRCVNIFTLDAGYDKTILDKTILGKTIFIKRKLERPEICSAKRLHETRGLIRQVKQRATKL